MFIRRSRNRSKKNRFCEIYKFSEKKKFRPWCGMTVPKIKAEIKKKISENLSSQILPDRSCYIYAEIKIKTLTENKNKKIRMYPSCERINEILDNISDDDLQILGINKHCKLNNYQGTSNPNLFPVPPVHIRPSFRAIDNRQ